MFQRIVASLMAQTNHTAANSIGNQLARPVSDNAWGNRKGGRKQAHRFSGVAAQRRAARKIRNQRKSK